MAASISHSLTKPQLSRAIHGPGLLARAMTALRHGRQQLRERRLLGDMSDRELKDFGATRGDVHRVLATPFWRSVPPC